MILFKVSLILLLTLGICAENTKPIGYIPGSDLPVYAIRDEQGRNLNFTVFLSKLQVFGDIVDDGESLVREDRSHIPLKKREAPLRFVNPSSDANITCIPLVDSNPRANLYHEDLISIAGSNVIKSAFGMPVPSNQTGRMCNSIYTEDCTDTYTITAEFSNAYQEAITLTDSSSYVRTIGSTKGLTTSDEVGKTITQTTEHSYTKGESFTVEDSSSDTNSNAYGKNTEKGGITITGNDTTIGNSSSSNESWDIAQCGAVDDKQIDSYEKSPKYPIGGKGQYLKRQLINKLMRRVPKGACQTGANGGGGVQIVVVSVNGEGGETYEWPHRTNGTSTDKNYSHTDTYSKQDIDVTTTTEMHDDSHTDTHGTSSTTDKSETVMYGSSEAKTTTHRVDVSKTVENSNSTTNGKENSNYKSLSNTTTLSIQHNYMMKTPPGKCMMTVFYPFVDAVITPFLCVTSDQVYQLRHNRILMPVTDSLHAGNKGVYMDVECRATVNDAIPQSNVPSYDTKNALMSDDIMYKKEVIKSADGIFSFGLTANGNFAITKLETVVWQTNHGYFTNYNTRARINDKGHLIVEAQNFFAKQVANYRKDHWLTVWSTAPNHHNYTIGMPRDVMDTTDQYKLIVADGNVVLYDALGVPIWCAMNTGNKACKNRFGFTLPEQYLVPTDFVSNLQVPGPFEIHNQMYPNTVVSNNRNISSMDMECGSKLISGQGIYSPNKRFALVLGDNGNLVFKDWNRTMWSSYTSNVVNTTGPYELILGSTGSALLRDSNYKGMWGTYTPNSDYHGGYRLAVLDEGKFVITTYDNKIVWDSSPISGMNQGAILSGYPGFCFSICEVCPQTLENHQTIEGINYSKTTTIATTTSSITTTTPTPAGPTLSSIKFSEICGEWMKTYNIDPFKSWGLMTDINQQKLYDSYECTCYNMDSKYNINSWTENPWGTLSDTLLQAQYNKFTCPCYTAQERYKIIPNPKNWGLMTDKKMQTEWTKLSCDSIMNVEPFISNPMGFDQNKPTTSITVAPTPTTSINVNMETNVVVTTETSVKVETTIVSRDMFPTVHNSITAVNTATITGITSKVTEYITSYTLQTPTSTTTSSTPTTTSTSCNRKLGLGDGKPGQCCKTQSDCLGCCSKTKFTCYAC